MVPILLIFLRINCYASVLFSAKTKKHLIEDITSLGLISNSRFMARLSYWMGGMAGLAPWIRQCAVVCLHAASRVQLFAMRAMDGSIMRCGIISSWQSAATAEIVKSS